MRVASSEPGQGATSRLYLWLVPANARGDWRSGAKQIRITQSYQRIEVEGSTRITPQTLFLRVALDEGHVIVGAPRQSQVLERLAIDRKQRCRGPELRAHVADRCPVGERQAG